MRRLTLLCVLALLPGCEQVLGIKHTSAHSHASVQNPASGTDAGTPTCKPEQPSGQHPSCDCPKQTQSDAGGEPSGDAGVTSTAGCQDAPSAEQTFRSKFAWPHHDLTVCYDTLDKTPLEGDAALAFMARVRSLAAGTFQRSAHLNLDFQGECETNHDIALLLTKEKKNETALGFPGTGQLRSVTLNVDTSSDAEILYALGRALGFEHEYGRALAQDACVACKKSEDCAHATEKTCLPSGYCGSERGQPSIMAAPDCGSVIEKEREFSRWDALGAARAYGEKPRGSLVGVTGECLTLTDSSTLRRGPCQDRERTRFRVPVSPNSAEPSRVRVTVDDVASCLSVNPGADDAELPVDPRPCVKDDTALHIGFGTVEIRVRGELCLSARSGEQTSPLALEPCGAHPGDSVFRLHDGLLQLDAGDRCATVSGEDTPNPQLQFAACDSSASSQQFRFKEGEITFTSGKASWCLSAQDGDAVADSAVGLTSCGLGREGGTFHVRGRLEFDSYCIAVSTPNMPAGKVSAVDCKPGEATQLWDYYF